ncbi:hypothetical protein HPC49_12535 [Pyxidicoccus fallax]|uniref:Uncharacterized protein n=1 Tax=Pyxidicoccus fallax TaxID=394095 RepID=A0A848LPV8_9BACT|nr:hypothetical protein [Pyxidicoccus fallax]NMO19613.1 hypothetical protein [Pyxidicoccus fallax]NPC79062.1 hypothetical protein [Pyxidicoccus fallax]
MKGRKWVSLGAVGTLVTCLGCSGVLWSVFSSGFLGTDKDTDDFTPQQQRRLLDKHFPVQVPPSATDLRIRYQAFQDWRLDISFTLPPGDFEAYVAELPLHPQEPGSYAGRLVLGDGGFVADASTITVDPEARRVKLHAFTW